MGKRIAHDDVTGYSHGSADGTVFVCVAVSDEIFDAIDKPSITPESDNLKVFNIPGHNLTVFIDRGRPADR